MNKDKKLAKKIFFIEAYVIGIAGIILGSIIYSLCNSCILQENTGLIGIIGGIMLLILTFIFQKVGIE